MGSESQHASAELWSLLKSVHDQGLASTGLKPKSFQRLTSFRSSPELGLFSKMFVCTTDSFTMLNSKWELESSSLNSRISLANQKVFEFFLHLFSEVPGKRKLQSRSQLDWNKRGHSRWSVSTALFTLEECTDTHTHVTRSYTWGGTTPQLLAAFYSSNPAHSSAQLLAVSCMASRGECTSGHFIQLCH